MESHNITGDFEKLEEIYVKRLVDIASNLNANSVVWQEVFDNGVVLPQDTVVHIWKDNMEEELAKVRQTNVVNYSHDFVTDDLYIQGNSHRFISSPKCSVFFWGPPSLLLNGNHGLFPWQ